MIECALDTIREFYGCSRAERSQVLKISHILAGLAVLHEIKSTVAAKAAYCLHPIFQDSASLAKYGTQVAKNLDPHVVLLVMEYRNQANAWLSDRVSALNKDEKYQNYSGWYPKEFTRTTKYGYTTQPSPGPLPEVRDMLIADKVQNYTDFRIYHEATHPRSQELTLYFEAWLQALGVCPDTFQKLSRAATSASLKN